MIIKHHLSLKGPGTKGNRISAFLLKDLLDVLADGTKGAIRLRIDGRSVARGADPVWLQRAADFDILGLHPGSTVIEIEALPLCEAAPEKFAQQNLFRTLNTSDSAFKVFEQSFEDAITGQADSELFDDALLNSYARLSHLFADGIDSFEITTDSRDARKVVVTSGDIENVKKLRRETPASQATRIAGQIDLIRYSDRMFELVLTSGERLRGVAPAEYNTSELANLWGRSVIVVGKAVFRPSGSILRIEASKIEPATGDTALWSKAPRARKHMIQQRELHRTQTEHSGLNKIWGKWPGDETEDQVRQALQ